MYLGSFPYLIRLYRLPLILSVGVETPKQSGKLRIYYEDQEVPNVTRTGILVWNRGTAAIQREHLKRPIRFCFPQGTRLLEIQVRRSTRPEIEFRASISPDSNHCVDCAFEFLDSNDGARFDIVHTSDDKPPTASGTVVGSPSGIQFLGHATKESSRLDVPFAPRVVRPFAQFALLMTLLIGPFLPPIVATQVLESDAAIIFFFALGGAGLVLGFRWAGSPAYKVPKALRSNDAFGDLAG
jgi:hypothetical protein